MRTRNFFTRSAGALVLAGLFGTGIAQALSPITVNKQFASGTVALGGRDQVTITVQNTSTTIPANITKFLDNLDTTGGVAVVDTIPADAPTTTCAGGVVSITGGDNNTISMAGGVIPVEVGVVPGSCTVTFFVFGNIVGTGNNIIHGDSSGTPDVTTDQGDPPLDIQQQITVAGSNVPVVQGPSSTVFYTGTGSVTFTITNPASTIPLTNVGFTVTGGAAQQFAFGVPSTLNNLAASCGGTITTTPGSITSGSVVVAGATIPAAGSCTITVPVTDPGGPAILPLVNFNLVANTVTDTQLASNQAGVSNQIQFTNGQPTLGKSFSNPKFVIPGTTNVVTLTIRNPMTTTSITGAQLIDPLNALSAFLTLDGAALLVNPTPANCGAAVLTGQGTGTATISNLTIPAATTCTLQITADIGAGAPQNASITNTIPVTDFTATGPAITQAANSPSDSLFVTGGGGGIITGKSASVSSAPPNVPFKYTLTFASTPSGVFTGGSFTDTLPQQAGLPLVVVNDAAHLPTTTNCSSGGAPVLTGIVNGATSASMTNLSTTSGGTCTVTFWAQFTGVPQGTEPAFLNTLVAGNVTFTGTSGAVNAINSPSATVVELPIITLTNYVASGSNLEGQPINVEGSINDTTNVADTNFTATFPLNAGSIQLLGSGLPGAGNFVFAAGCPTGANAPVVTEIAGGFTIFTPSISATCTFTYNVIDAGTPPTAATGTFTPGNMTYKSDLTLQNPSQNFSPTNNVTYAQSNLLISKVFSPNQIQAGGVSTVQVTTSVVGLTGFPQTQANGVTFADTLPANVSFTSTNPNVTFSANCQLAGQPAPGYNVAGTTISFTNISLLTIGTTPQSCVVTFDVTSSTTPAAPVNQINAHTMGSTSGISNNLAADATLTVNTGVAIQKTFVPSTLPIGTVGYVRFLLTNTASSTPLTAGSLVDNMLPNTVVLASTALGLTQPLDPVSCGGSLNPAEVDTATFHLTNLTVAGATGVAPVTPAQCVVYVPVIAAPGVAPGPISNSIAAGALVIGGQTNQGGTTGNGTLGPAPNVTIAKAFVSTTPPLTNTIQPGGTATLTITINNNAAGAAALTGMSVTDTLPPGITVAATPATSTTCGAGTVTAPAGGTTVALTNGSLGTITTPTGSCTITVNVTGSTSGIFTNTISAGTLTTTQGAVNGNPAQAILNIGNTSGVGITKAFLQTVIPPGGTSVLTVTIVNNAATAVPLTNLGVIDTLPTNVTVAATPNTSTTCAGGTATAVAGGSTLTLAGATLAVNASCTMSVTVTGTVVGTYTNTIPINAITSTQGATNGAPTSANITIGQPQLAVSKTSSPSGSSVTPGQTINYTVTVTNNGTQAETNAHVVDVLANATLTPGSVKLNGAAAADAIISSQQPFAASLAIGATATITYSATVNAIAPVGAQVTNTATIAGNQPCLVGVCASTSPPNAVIPPVIAVTKLIDGNQSEPVVAGQTVTYSMLVANTGGGPAIGTVLTDGVPNGLTVVPNSVTINTVAAPGATVTGQVVTVPLGAVAAGTTSTVAFKAVIGPKAGNVSNTVSVNADGLARAAVSNAALAHQVPAAIAVTKTTPSTTVSTGDRVNFTITATPVGGVGYGLTTLVDTLPDYEVYAPGTSRVAGKAQEPVVAGHVLTWTVPTLAAPLTITYSTAVAPGSEANVTLTNLVNVTAVAPGGGGVGRGSASASVLVVGSTFGSCYPITGRVYLDVNGSGHFQDPDIGLHSVKIFLDDGESVITDSTGRYDYPCVHPGMHALRLDELTLPPGIVPYLDRNIDSEKSTRRLVHHIYDTTIIEDINFAVTGTPETPLEPGGSGSQPK
jgi:uncharacterized repeat protein (TIGR01451 family)